MPGISTNCIRPLSVFISTRTVSSAVTRPFSPRNRLVLIEYSRTPPSSWAEETRKTFDHCGQGFVGVAAVGRPGDDLELVDALAPLAMDGAQAVGAGVAAADDDHVLVAGPR